MLSKIKNMYERTFYKKLFNISKLIIIPNIIHKFDEKLNAPPKDSALKDYTHLFDKIINKSLRNNLISTKTLEMLNSIIYDINKYKINEDIILFRGITKYIEYNIGDIVNSKGFSSKTRNIKISNIFAEKKDYILMFSYNKNIPICDLSSISYFNESEFITLPNEIFKISDKYNIYIENKIYNVLYCEHIGFDEINCNINIINDFLFDKYEKLLNVFIDKLNNNNILILYNGYNYHTIYYDSKSLIKLEDTYNYLKTIHMFLELDNIKDYGDKTNKNIF